MELVFQNIKTQIQLEYFSIDHVYEKYPYMKSTKQTHVFWGETVTLLFQDIIVLQIFAHIYIFHRYQY